MSPLSSVVERATRTPFVMVRSVVQIGQWAFCFGVSIWTNFTISSTVDSYGFPMVLLPSNILSTGGSWWVQHSSKGHPGLSVKGIWVNGLHISCDGEISRYRKNRSFKCWNRDWWFCMKIAGLHRWSWRSQSGHQWDRRWNQIGLNYSSFAWINCVNVS